jgi:hypothetical protein
MMTGRRCIAATTISTEINFRISLLGVLLRALFFCRQYELEMSREGVETRIRQFKPVGLKV